MSKWMSWGHWARAALVALVPVVSAGSMLAPHARDGMTAPPAANEIAADVDGDGQLDRVRWRRYGDDYWVDVALAQPDGSFALRSSTRVAPANRTDEWTWRARDVDGDGRADLVVRQNRAAARAWISDGRGFSEAPPAVPTWAALSAKRGRE